MQVLERRKIILDIFSEKGILSYNQILNEMSEFDPLDILLDIDTLVFFKFLQHAEAKKSKINLETRLELESNTRDQLKDDPSRIHSRIQVLEHETPPWYRKLAILTILKNEMCIEEVVHLLNEQASRLNWHPTLVKASLKMLKKRKYVLERRTKDSTRYTLRPQGKVLLTKEPFDQFSSLKPLKDEYNIYLRANEIIELVKGYHKHGGISSRDIIGYLQEEYGLRGNQKNAILTALNAMTATGLLIVTGGVSDREGNVYQLGPSVKPSDSIESKINDHSVQDFKETVEKLFNKYNVSKIRKDRESRIKKILSDFEQQKNILASRNERIDLIIFLSDCLENAKGKSWENQIFSCIIACILSRLLPPKVAYRLLRNFYPPEPSGDQFPYQIGISREYYFTLTENCITLGKYEEALQSFDILKLLSWKSPEFLVLKGRIEMYRCDVRKPGEFRRILDIFNEALQMAEGDPRMEKIVVPFYMGLAHYQRGYFKEAETLWEKCLELPLPLSQEIVVRHSLANAHALSGNLNQAKTLYEQNMKKAEALEMDEHKVNSFISLTDVLVDLCLYEEAEQKLKETIEECETKEFLRAEALARATLGDLLTRKGKFEEALSCLEGAVGLAYMVCNPYERGSILIQLGDTFRKMKMLDEAIDSFDRALAQISKSDLDLMLTAEIKKADTFIDKGNLDKGLELSGSVLEEEWLDDHHLTAEAYRIQGRVYLLKGNFQRARDYLVKSESILKKVSLQYELLEVYELLERCCKMLKDEEKEAFYRAERENLQQHIGLS
ncbi:MAG: tetratricopeptide repeat protein [Theionarchaea archaeon]|nr:tetratricopeptide repeat protein [Theionarchaea archaeon]